MILATPLNPIRKKKNQNNAKTQLPTLQTLPISPEDTKQQHHTMRPRRKPSLQQQDTTIDKTTPDLSGTDRAAKQRFG